MRVNIPAQDGKKQIHIQTDVTNNELKLFLSKTAIKKAVIKIDFTKEKINISGQDITIKFTFSGHYFSGQYK